MFLLPFEGKKDSARREEQQSSCAGYSPSVPPDLFSTSYLHGSVPLCTASVGSLVPRIPAELVR